VDQHTRLEPSQAFFHGAFLVFLDALGLGATAIGQSANSASELCSQFLSDQLKDLSAIDGETNGTDEAMDTEDNNNEMFTFGGFSVPRGTSLCCVPFSKLSEGENCTRYLHEKWSQYLDGLQYIQ
jgi:hypothetical protein